MTSTQLDSSQFIGAYAVIPSFIIFDNDLDRGCIQLFALLMMMSGEKGNCWPSNKFLIDKLQTSERNLHYWLSQLQNKEYIIVTTDRTGFGAKRTIWLPEFHRRFSNNSYTMQQIAGPPATHCSSAQYREEKENIKQPPLSPKGKREFSSKVKTMTEYLLQEIRSHKPDFRKPNLDTWHKDMHGIIKVDDRDPDKVTAVIAWATKDPFWQSVIMSPSGLRKNFDQIEKKMIIPLKPANPHGKEAIKEKIIKHFKKGEKYNEAEFNYDDNGLGFTRGLKHAQIKWTEFDFKARFLGILTDFQIKGFALD